MTFAVGGLDINLGSSVVRGRREGREHVRQGRRTRAETLHTPEGQSGSKERRRTLGTGGGEVKLVNKGTATDSRTVGWGWAGSCGTAITLPERLSEVSSEAVLQSRSFTTTYLLTSERRRLVRVRGVCLDSSPRVRAGGREDVALSTQVSSDPPTRVRPTPLWEPRKLRRSAVHPRPAPAPVWGASRGPRAVPRGGAAGCGAARGPSGGARPRDGARLLGPARRRAVRTLEGGSPRDPLGSNRRRRRLGRRREGEDGVGAERAPEDGPTPGSARWRADAAAAPALGRAAGRAGSVGDRRPRAPRTSRSSGRRG